MSETWSAAATHVVCAVNENKEARRTLKYMQVRSPQAVAYLQGAAVVHEAKCSLMSGSAAQARATPALHLHSYEVCCL